MLESRTHETQVSKFEDPTPIARYPDGGVITAGAMAQLFSKRSPEQQEKLAYSTVLKHKANPTLVVSWVTDEQLQDKIKVWCIGQGLGVKTSTVEPGELNPLLEKDSELIEKFGPYLRQVDLARLLTVRRYKNADPSTQNTLVWGTYRLLGEYLGPRRYYAREMETPKPLSIPDLPPEIFSDELTRGILLESEREALVPIFNKNIKEGFDYLKEKRSQTENPGFKDFIDETEEYFRKACDFQVPGFKSKISGAQKDFENIEEIEYSDYPSFHQREYAYRFINKGNVDLLIGATRTMKSGAAQYALRAAGSKSGVIICPSGINKLNWERELQEKLDKNANIITVNSTAELKTLAINPPRIEPDYTIIGYQLLSRLSIEESRMLFQQLKSNLGWDGLIADEVHLAKEPDAECTQQLNLLSTTLSENAPRIAMTATGIINLVEDLDAPIRALLPYRYKERGDFTRAARNDPNLVSALLHGDHLMTRWAKEAILGDRLPNLETHELPVPFTPFHQQLYEFVYYDDTIESPTKRGLLRQASLEPLLIRKHYHPDRIKKVISNLEKKLDNRQDDREREIIIEKIKALSERYDMVTSLSNIEEAKIVLASAYGKFIEWKATHNSDEKFDEDFLVKMGYENVALWAFLNLYQGMDEVVQKQDNKEIAENWEGKDDLFSSKYNVLKSKIDEQLAEGKKLMIFSGFYQSGITSGIEDVSHDDELAFLSLYDRLRMWYGDDSILKIDGKVNIDSRYGELADREKVRREWRLNPEKRIILLTIRSSRLGIDLSIPPTSANEQITGLEEIFIDLPDTYADVEQAMGRGWGPGSKLPVGVTFLKATNLEQPNTFRYGFIDHGMWEAIEFKRLLSQMVLDGVPLTEDEEKKVQAHMSKLKIELYPQTPRKHLFVDFLNKVRGQGIDSNLGFLKQKGFEDMTNVDFFTAYYPENDQFSSAGHAARAVSEIIKKITNDSDDIRVGSIGAGAGILESTLGKPVVNVDMLEDILQVAKKRTNSKGHYVVGEAASIPISNQVFDLTDVSFMLHWSSNKNSGDSTYPKSERSEIIKELNRVTKDNGTVIISLPVSHLDRESFTKWLSVLEQNFGFRQRNDIPSGLLRATDYKTEQVSWLFVLDKVGGISEDYNLSDLSFEFESVFKILDKTGVGNGNDVNTLVNPIPHLEFEIVDQSEGRAHKIKLTMPDKDKRLEEFLLSDHVVPYSDDLSVLAAFGIEEYAFYNKLAREAQLKYHLDSVSAKNFAREALVEWAQSGSQRHDFHRVWAELKSYMEKLIEEGGKK